MPTIELTDEEAKYVRNAIRAQHGGRPTSPTLAELSVLRKFDAPKPLVPGDIVRSNGDKTVQGTVLGVSGGYVCFDTGISHGPNPFRIMLAELLERV